MAAPPKVLRKVAPLVLLVLAACTADGPLLAPDASSPEMIIVDGSTTGNSHFFFRPPLVSGEPTPNGAFDPTVRPRVEICEWDGAACVDGGALFVYTTAGGPEGERIRISEEDESYAVNWSTRLDGIEANDVFRARVFVVNLELGYVDLELGANGGEVKNINTGDNIGLVDGRTLPLAFRIEEGAVAESEEQAEAECFDEFGNVIDCDVVAVQNENGGTAVVFEDPDEPDQTLAAILELAPDDAVDANGNPVSDYVVTLTHVVAAPADPADIPTVQQVPFFVDVTALDAGGNPVFFTNGATLTLCQPPDLGDPLADLYIPDPLHDFLEMFQVQGGITTILASTLDNQANCPGGLHGGLNTVGLRSFSGFGATLPTLPSASTAVVPDGTAGTPTTMTVQAKVDGSGNQVLGGDEVVVTVTGANSATPAVVDNGDGTYSAQYTPTNVGTDQVAIQIRNVLTGALEPISGSPYTSVVGGPDLIVSSVGPVSLIGNALSVDVTIANTGGEAPEYPAASTWDVAIYLSTDAVLDASDVHVTSMYSVWTYPVGVGFSVGSTRNGLLPAGTAPGTYYLIALADAFPGQPPNFYPGVVETDETNNWTASPAFTVPAPAADQLAYVDVSTFQIFTMDSDGSNVSQATTSAGIKRYPSWSPDRTQFAYGGSDIFTSATDGSGAVNLTSAAAGVSWDPEWSPDGTKIVFVTNRDQPGFATGNEIYVMDADGSNPIRLTTNTAMDSQPSWSPDGTKIVWTSEVLGSKRIFMMNADGTGQVRISFFGSVGEENPRFSPDGTKVAFTHTLAPGPGGRIVTVMNSIIPNPVNDSHYMPLTTAGSDSEPVWSPDGTQIAFLSGRAGLGYLELYTMDANGNAETRISFTGAGAVDPAWRR